MRWSEQNSCEAFGVLISAEMDGELTELERDLLNDHLANCQTCQNRKEAFARIDETLFESTLQALHHSNSTLVKEPGGRQSHDPVVHRRWSANLLRAVPFAAAAAVMAGLFVSAWPVGETVTAEEIAVPLAEFEMLQDERRSSQDQVLEFFELELRALKLQLAAIESDRVSEDLEADWKSARDKLQSLIEKVHDLNEDIYK